MYDTHHLYTVYVFDVLCMTEFVHEVLDGYDNKTVLRLCSGILEAFEFYSHYALIIVMNKIKRVIQ